MGMARAYRHAHAGRHDIKEDMIIFVLWLNEKSIEPIMLSSSIGYAHPSKWSPDAESVAVHLDSFSSTSPRTGSCV
jgi:hypothetical protein